MATPRKVSAKPTQPPAFDAAMHEKALYDSVRKPDGSPYQAFGDKAYATWKQWVESTGTYDSKGLRDVVNQNAMFTDAIKGDVDLHGQAIIELRADVQALKEAPAARPFP